MSPFVGVGVIVALMLAVRFWRDHGTCATRVQFFQEPIRIERFIRQKRAERDTPDQRRDAFHVMRLTGQQQKADKVSKRIDQGHDFGRQTAARAPDSLSVSPPFAPVAFW